MRDDRRGSSPSLVVCFRWHDVESEVERFHIAAERIRNRLSPLQAERIGWSSDRQSFAVPVAAFPGLLRATIELLTEASTHAVGIGQSPLERNSDNDCWGRALVLAEALASSANPGEVLLAPELDAVQREEVATHGRFDVRVGASCVSAALLLAGSAPVTGLASDAAYPGLGRSLQQTTPSRRPSLRSLAPTKPVAGHRPQRTDPSGAGTPAPAARPTPGEATLSADTANSRRDSFPEASERPLDSALGVASTPTLFEALRSGDGERMLRVAEQLRATGGKWCLARRMEALGNLASGDVMQGLARLEHAARLERLQEFNSDGACKALLAYAVGLAISQRVSEARLEALSALAAARRAGDRRGEQASARLLGQLAQSDGRNAIGEAWLAVATELE